MRAATIAATFVLLVCIAGDHLFVHDVYGRFRWRDVAFSLFAVACLAYLAIT